MSSGDGLLYMQYYDNNIKCYLTDGNSEATIRSGAFYPDLNTFYHIEFFRVKDKVKLVIDNVVKDSAYFSSEVVIPNTTPEIFIGGYWSLPAFMNGYIDNFKFQLYDPTINTILEKKQVKLSSILKRKIGQFTDSDLSAGILTITHNWNLSVPYICITSICDENNMQLIPDDITYNSNEVVIDLSSAGTLNGSYSYLIIR
jgi:hypothetical protein